MPSHDPRTCLPHPPQPSNMSLSLDHQTLTPNAKVQKPPNATPNAHQTEKSSKRERNSKRACGTFFDAQVLERREDRDAGTVLLDTSPDQRRVGERARFRLADGQLCGRGEILPSLTGGHPAVFRFASGPSREVVYIAARGRGPGPLGRRLPRPDDAACSHSDGATGRDARRWRGEWSDRVSDADPTNIGKERPCLYPPLSERF